VVNHFKFTYRIGLAIIFVLLLSGLGWGTEQGGAEPAASGSTAVPGPIEEKELLEVQEPAPSIKDTHSIMDAYAGYQFINVNRYGGRAAEYEYLHSNPVLGGLANYLGQDTKFSLEGGYLNDKEFHGELTYDYKGIYRFTLRTESLFHNLDHDQLFTPPFTLNGNSYAPADLNPTDIYGERVEQDLAQFRYKFTQLPIHLNLGYWRMVKEGTAQMRFADQAFEGTPNTIYAKSRTIDNQTHEGMFGLDSHLGLFDLIYDFRIREFWEQTAIPVDNFLPRLAPNLVMQSNGGLLQHNDKPGSRFYAQKIGVHTSMSGGLVGAASYSYGKQENLSNITDFGGAVQTYNIIQNIAGDISYTPCHAFSIALKYRHQDVERNGPAALANLAGIAANPPVLVRPPMDTQKDTVTATLSYRPVALLTIKGEYKGEFLARDNADFWQQPGVTSTINFPSHSTTHTGTISLISRSFKGVRLYAEYKYSTTDRPAYANGYDEMNQGSFQASYNTSSRWGISASTRITRENSDNLSISTIDPNQTHPPGSPLPSYPIPRERKGANATVSFWLVPFKNLTVTGSYGLLRYSIDQPALFASVWPGIALPASYTSQAQIYGVNAVYRYDDKLDMSLALQQVRSYAMFDPQFFSSPPNDTIGITGISRNDTMESTIATRADYRFAKNFSCALEYAFKDYDEKNSSLYNGSVNTVMLYLATKW